MVISDPQHNSAQISQKQDGCIWVYIYIYVIMKTMCCCTVYRHNGFDNKYQTLIKIKNNREMVCNISPNMKSTPPCTPLPQ